MQTATGKLSFNRYIYWGLQLQARIPCVIFQARPQVVTKLRRQASQEAALPIPAVLTASMLQSLGGSVQDSGPTEHALWHSSVPSPGISTWRPSLGASPAHQEWVTLRTLLHPDSRLSTFPLLALPASIFLASVYIHKMSGATYLGVLGQRWSTHLSWSTQPLLGTAAGKTKPGGLVLLLYCLLLYDQSQFVVQGLTVTFTVACLNQLLVLISCFQN